MKNFLNEMSCGVMVLLVACVSGCGDDALTPMGTDTDGDPPPEVNAWKYDCWNGNADNYFWRPVGSAAFQDFPNPLQPCVEVEPGSTGWEAAVRAKCSSYCQSLNWNNLGAAVCEDENWSSVEPWEPHQMCPVPTALMDFDDIETVLGSAAALDAEDLACDLSSSCIELLDKDAMYGMVMPPTSNVRDTADVLMETDTAQVSEVVLLGDDAALVGQAAYTALSCAEDACPFYLAQFDLEATSSLIVSLVYGSTPLTKAVSDLEIGLARPALGMWLPDSGDVIFPPYSLAVRVSATLSGSPNPFGENGPHDTVFGINQYVYGTLDGGVLSLSHSGTDILGNWSLEAHFVPE